MADNDHPRRIMRGVFPLEVCKELEFIHKSNCTVGYRPSVFSTTLSHLIATNSSHLVMPFVALRERIKEEVEQAFGCEFELFVEFTGLISWTKGASIGWHSDDNRPYLKQRDFAAVCYLNNFEEHFKGGLFHFQKGEPTTVVPMAGDLLIYTADSRNVHSVDEITDGERLTLTLWFTRNADHDEDAKLLSHLSQNFLVRSPYEPALYIPQPASKNMYWLLSNQETDQQEGFDIRLGRLAVLGYDICPSQGQSGLCEFITSNDPSEILIEPLHLIWRGKFLDKEFANILHALQVVQFYHWKGPEPQEPIMDCAVVRNSPLTESQRENIGRMKGLLMKDTIRAEEAFVYPAACGRSGHCSFDEVSFSALLSAWEAYSHTLLRELRMSLPHWISHQSIFVVPLENKQ